MRLISAPAGLRLSLAALLLCVPMAGIEVVLAMRAPWWRLPVSEMVWAAALAFLFWSFLALLALKTHRWTVPIATGACVIWFFGSMGLAFLNRAPALAFFSALILPFGAIPAFWLRRELGRSFLDPGLRWYQGLPQPIGSLSCTLVVPAFAEGQPGIEKECRVSRLDTEGAFIYSGKDGLTDSDAPITRVLKRGRPVQLQFGFRGEIVRCTGIPVSALQGGAGGGFGTGIQFRGLNPDGRKDLGDFIEALRGEGYVD